MRLTFLRATMRRLDGRANGKRARFGDDSRARAVAVVTADVAVAATVRRLRVLAATREDARCLHTLLTPLDRIDDDGQKLL